MQTHVAAYPIISALETVNPEYKQLWLDRILTKTPVEICIIFSREHRSFYVAKEKRVGEAEVLKQVAEAFWTDRFPLFSSNKTSPYSFSLLKFLEP